MPGRRWPRAPHPRLSAPDPARTGPWFPALISQGPGPLERWGLGRGIRSGSNSHTLDASVLTSSSSTSWDVPHSSIQATGPPSLGHGHSFLRSAPQSHHAWYSPSGSLLRPTGRRWSQPVLLWTLQHRPAWGWRMQGAVCLLEMGEAKMRQKQNAKQHFNKLSCSSSRTTLDARGAGSQG